METGITTLMEYNIFSMAGVDMGPWHGRSAAEALAAMLNDAGYNVAVSDDGQDVQFADPADALVAGGRHRWIITGPQN